MPPRPMSIQRIIEIIDEVGNFHSVVVEDKRDYLKIEIIKIFSLPSKIENKLI